MNEHLSDLALDNLRLGGREGQAHLEGCALCQARQAELASDADAFEARFVPAQLAADTLAAAEAPSQRRGSFLRLFAVAGTAAAVAALLIVAEPDDGLRTKGSGALFSLFQRIDGERVRVEGVVERDARLELRAEAAGYVRVLWETEAGAWTPLFPSPGGDAWRIEGPSWLPREVVLDGAPATERIGVVVCDTEVGAVEARAVLDGGYRSGCRAQYEELSKR